MPAKPEAITGPVFEINALRSQGIHVCLQQYEGFRFPQHLPYIKAYLEDALGVPIFVNIAGSTIDEYVQLAARLDPIEQIAAIEANRFFSCVAR